jgi:hypothetical protein
VTKGGSLGRSGMWKSLTLSRHDAADPAISPPASAAGDPCSAASSLCSPMPPAAPGRSIVGHKPQPANNRAARRRRRTSEDEEEEREEVE